MDLQTSIAAKSTAHHYSAGIYAILRAGLIREQSIASLVPASVCVYLSHQRYRLLDIDSESRDSDSQRYIH